MKTAIIGIGSPFGDDQAGWLALDALQQETWVKAQEAAGILTLQKLDRPGMSLLEHWHGYDHVMLIDAVISTQHAPGMLFKLQPEELALLEFPTSSHGFGIAEVLALGETLGLLPKQLDIWGVAVPFHNVDSNSLTTGIICTGVADVLDWK
ncbi:hydrogenase maturation protease [Thiothrix caldifontis]|uniref:Hydrogenase maturation protease n=1 Tax=Thiothrix caldifontis TaxID=525918 RepID=A0A1H3ZC97_9GAMM|nr:hydrogenase maturation protease [Thiothrix caldifontis]SEA20972.1 hydrogenase maturation protease [Thiothrix caldifontis]